MSTNSSNWLQEITSRYQKSDIGSDELPTMAATIDIGGCLVLTQALDVLSVG
jgi:hypothetical protein